MCAQLPFSPLSPPPQDRTGPAQPATSLVDGRARREQAASHASPSTDALEPSNCTGRRRWLWVPVVHQIYAVSIAIAVAVVLLWQGSLGWLAVGALLLGLLTVPVFLALALLALHPRAGMRHGRPRQPGP